MAEWPHCLTEAETLDRLLSGQSIARLGDGEFGIALGSGNSTHAPNPRLAKEFRRILIDPSPGCLPAIPTMDPKSPRYERWSGYMRRYRPLLDMSRTYGSAFVGQTVSSPWIGTAAHADAFCQVWAGKHVVAVQHDTSGLARLLERHAAKITWVPCLKEEAYSAIDDLEKSCLEAGADIAVIVAGPCATALANRLAGHGLQAIDLGRGVGVILGHWTP